MHAKKPTILFVCTGNVCRSPAAEFVLRDLLGTTASRFQIRSAGTAAMPGQPVDPVIAALLARKGIDSDKFRSRSLDVSLIDQADLILTASTAHRSTVARLRPAALHKTLTLKQLARYSAAMVSDGSRPPQAEQRIPWVLASLPRARARSPRAASDSIADPIGQSRRQYENVFDEVVRACAALVALFAARPDPAPSGQAADVRRQDNPGGGGAVRLQNRLVTDTQ